jgi:CheY-like chemotaxis protein
MNGIQGLEKMNQKLQQCCRQPYKVIFVDLNMPLMCGQEVSKTLLTNHIDDGLDQEVTIAWSIY